MKLSQQIDSGSGEAFRKTHRDGSGDQLLLLFGPTDRLGDPQVLTRVRRAFPDAAIVGCSTAGEIIRGGTLNETLTATALTMRNSRIRVHRVKVLSIGQSRQAGLELAAALRADDLQYVMVLSDGLAVNGAELTLGLRQGLGDDIIISGGLAGDGVRFSRTYVVDGDKAYEKHVVCVGFYGASLAVGSSSSSGWIPFGMFREITRSEGNVVYEIDGARALDVYSTYLGEEAASLPASGLLYPLAVRIRENDTGLVRTLVGIDRSAGSLTFAGSVPQGSTARLMHASYDHLVQGAARAGEMARLPDGRPGEVALLISCMGRKSLMGAYADLEVEAVAGQLPQCPVLTGFHSYGEIGFYEDSGTCELHNQTMTVTVLSE